VAILKAFFSGFDMELTREISAEDFNIGLGYLFIVMIYSPLLILNMLMIIVLRFSMYFYDYYFTAF
jgi:hypothetical protein